MPLTIEILSYKSSKFRELKFCEEKHGKISIVFKEDNLDCYIVYTIVFSFPGLNCFVLEYLDSFLHVVSDERRNDQLHDFLTRHELPKPVWTNYYKFIV